MPTCGRLPYAWRALPSSGRASAATPATRSPSGSPGSARGEPLRAGRPIAKQLTRHASIARAMHPLLSLRKASPGSQSASLRGCSRLRQGCPKGCPIVPIDPRHALRGAKHRRVRWHPLAPAGSKAGAVPNRSFNLAAAGSRGSFRSTRPSPRDLGVWHGTRRARHPRVQPLACSALRQTVGRASWRSMPTVAMALGLWLKMLASRALGREPGWHALGAARPRAGRTPALRAQQARAPARPSPPASLRALRGPAAEQPIAAAGSAGQPKPTGLALRARTSLA